MGRYAFTLLEVLVATALAGVTLVAVEGAIHSISKAQVKAESIELLQRLAADKLSEYGGVVVTGTTGDNGDFTDRGYPKITWALELESASADYVDLATVTVTNDKEKQSLSELIFVRPASTTTTNINSGPISKY
jgi:prepilin-type N-terminal cleavage/methylation domain-containing protein